MSHFTKCFLICFWLCAVTAQAKAEIFYIHNDHLGNPQAVTDENRNIVWQGESGPFGELVTETGSIRQPHRFPGQHADPETGLYYNYFRDYDPSLGRYVQSDPVGVMRDYSDPQMQVAIQQGIPLGSVGSGLNHNYGYAEQNPVLYTDPFGDGVWSSGACAAYGAYEWYSVGDFQADLNELTKNHRHLLNLIDEELKKCEPGSRRHVELLRLQARNVEQMLEIMRAKAASGVAGPGELIAGASMAALCVALAHPALP